MLPLLPILLSALGLARQECLPYAELSPAAERPGHLLAGRCFNKPAFILGVEQVGRDVTLRRSREGGGEKISPPTG